MSIKFLTRPWVYHTLFLLGLMLLFGIWATTLGQDANFDLKNYHWYNAYAFLHHRLGWDIAPAMLMTYYNPSLDLIDYFIITQSHTPKVAEFLLGTFHGINAYFLFRIAAYLIKVESPFLRYIYILIGVLLGITGSASISQLGTTHNEALVSIFIMAAVFFALKYINSAKKENPLTRLRHPLPTNNVGRGASFSSLKGTKNNFILLAALILGLGAGAKLTALSYAIAFFITLSIYKKPDWQHLKLVFITGIAFCLGFFITGGFWMWTLYTHFHNPLFPYYNNVFHSPYVSFGDFADKRFMAKGLLQTIFYPFYWLQQNNLTQELGMADARIAAVITLCVLYLIYNSIKKICGLSVIASETEISKNHILTVRFLFIFLAASYIVWLLHFSIYRYTIPIGFLSGIFIVYFFIKLFQPKIIQLQIFQLPLVLLMAWMVINNTVYADWGRVPYNKTFFVVSAPNIPPDSMVVMMGGDPTAYLISHFPPQIRFVGFYNNIVNPNNPFFEKQVSSIITQYKGPLYLMTGTDFFDQAKTILIKYNLKILDKKCQFISSNMENNPIPICPITPVSDRN